MPIPEKRTLKSGKKSAPKKMSIGEAILGQPETELSTALAAKSVADSSTSAGDASSTCGESTAPGWKTEPVDEHTVDPPCDVSTQLWSRRQVKQEPSDTYDGQRPTLAYARQRRRSRSRVKEEAVEEETEEGETEAEQSVRKDVDEEGNATMEQEAPNVEESDRIATLKLSWTEETRVDESRMEETPAKDPWAEEAPTEQTPMERTPMEDTLVEETPVGGTRVEETSVEGTRVEETPEEEQGEEVKSSSDDLFNNADIISVASGDTSCEGEWAIAEEVEVSEWTDSDGEDEDESEEEYEYHRQREMYRREQRRRNAARDFGQHGRHASVPSTAAMGVIAVDEDAVDVIAIASGDENNGDAEEVPRKLKRQRRLKGRSTGKRERKRSTDDLGEDDIKRLRQHQAGLFQRHTPEELAEWLRYTPIPAQEPRLLRRYRSGSERCPITL